MVDVLNPIDIIETDIKRLFVEYCGEYGIEDMAKEKQTRFCGAMTYIYRRYFKVNNSLKVKPYHKVAGSPNGIETNFNAYDVNLLYELYLFLKEFANGYDKVASVPAFKALTGISKQTLSVWRNGRASSPSLDRDKKMFLEWLTENEEDDLKEFNLRMPIGAQERLNVDYGRREVKVSVRAEAAEIAQTPEEIAARYGKALPDGARVELPEVPE